MRWACALFLTIAAGSVGYPWFWFKGEKLERELTRIDNLRNIILGDTHNAHT